MIDDSEGIKISIPGDGLPLPLPAGYEMSNGELLPIPVLKPDQIPSYTVISDWKNHAVRLNENYEILIDVAAPLRSYLLGGIIVSETVLPTWVRLFHYDPAGFYKSAINNMLEYSSDYGKLKNMIRVNWDQCHITDDASMIILNFTVISNTWVLAVIAAAIATIGVFVWLSIREIRLLYRENPDLAKKGKYETEIMVLLAIMLIAGYFIFVRKTVSG